MLYNSDIQPQSDNMYCNYNIVVFGSIYFKYSFNFVCIYKLLVY